VAFGWEKQRTAEYKAKILNQLKRMVAELRTIPAPGGCGVSNVMGGAVSSGTIPIVPFGPFDSVQAFHDWLHEHASYHPENYPKLNELLELHKRDWPLCFTHGDLTPLNIMVKDERVTGIIDWETSRWWPSYWEYTTAWHCNPWVHFWRQNVDLFIDAEPEALYMDRLRNDIFGHAGCVLEPAETTT